LERKLIQKLGEEVSCPHGNEINMGAAQRRKAGLVLLAEVPAGTPVKVVAIYERDRALLEYLDGLGIRPGSQVQVLSCNYDETIVLDLGLNRAHLGQAAAKRVWVRVDRDHPDKGVV
jgi:DtxR family Mn-dependent transcriptional regulator